MLAVLTDHQEPSWTISGHTHRAQGLGVLCCREE